MEDKFKDTLTLKVDKEHKKKFKAHIKLKGLTCNGVMAQFIHKFITSPDKTLNFLFAE